MVGYHPRLKGDACYYATTLWVSFRPSTTISRLFLHTRRDGEARYRPHFVGREKPFRWPTLPRIPEYTFLKVQQKSGYKFCTCSASL